MVIKKSARLMVKRFILIELTALALYIVSGSLVYYAKIYRESFFARFIPFQTAQIIFLFTLQTLLVVLNLWIWNRQAKQSISGIDELLNQSEHEKLEFKSSLRWDLKAQRVNKNLERSVMKTIAAFLNSRGGTLVIGVDDHKNVIGLDQDYATLVKQNSDGFENHFSNIFHSMIGPGLRNYIRIRWEVQQGRECCVITVAPSQRPAFVRFDEVEEFYIRTGNGTTSLKMSEATNYIKSRFA